MIAKEAIKTNDISVFNQIVEKGADDWDSFAEAAAENELSEMFEDFIVRGADREKAYKKIKSYSMIAEDAAFYGQKKILYDIIELGASSYEVINNIACFAAKGGHLSILNDMIKRGVDGWNEIAYYAFEGKEYSIMNDMFRRGADNYDEIASVAVDTTNAEALSAIILLKDDVEFLNTCALRALDHNDKLKDIVNELIDKGSNDFNAIAKKAGERGYRTIVREMIKKGAKWTWIYHN